MVRDGDRLRAADVGVAILTVRSTLLGGVGGDALDAGDVDAE